MNSNATISTLSILDVTPYIFGNTEQQIAFLQQRGLLATSMTCGSCSGPMALGQKRDISDSCMFRCSTCKTTKSLRTGSFFSKSKLPLNKWLVLLYWWIRQYPVGDAAEEAKVSRETAINVYQWLREVCSSRLLANPIVLGGAGKTVQIDESLFRHKPKVSEPTALLTFKFIVFYNCSIIVGVPPSKRFGFLGWWTLHISQH